MEDATFMARVQSIAGQTDENDHSGAMVEGITLMMESGIEGLDHLHGRAVSIMEEHHNAGELTTTLAMRRRTVYQDMMDLAQRHFSPKRYEAFYGAF